jgi:hypothetical protein
MIALTGSLIAALSVGVALACLAILRLRFPRHVLKIKESHILPVALPILLFLGLPLALITLRRISLPQCQSADDFVNSFVMEMKEDPSNLWWILFSVLILYLVSIIATYWGASYLKKTWSAVTLEDDLRRFRQKRSGRFRTVDPKGWRRKFRVAVANFVEVHLLNEFSKITRYHPDLEVLMADIRTTDGFLFSGKFSEYHWDGQECSGMALTNVMRFNNGKSAEDTPLSTAEEEAGHRIYLFPNNGKIFFPQNKIQDMHFWRIQRRFKYIRELKGNKDAKMLAWWLSLQWALPKLKLEVSAIINDEKAFMAARELVTQLNRFQLTEADVKLQIDDKIKRSDVED